MALQSKVEYKKFIDKKMLLLHDGNAEDYVPAIWINERLFIN